MILVVGTAIGIWWVMRYAARVQTDPSTSLVASEREANQRAFQGRRDRRGPAATDGTQKLVLVAFFLAFVLMIVGVIPWSDLGIEGIPTWGWWFPEMTASSCSSRSSSGSSGGCRRAVHELFVDGARDLLGVALIIGIARGVTVIMNNGLITDTVLTPPSRRSRPSAASRSSTSCTACSCRCRS